jgi:apolipoprotein N-acyltransferase
MKAEPSVNWIGGVVIIAVGVFFASCGLFLFAVFRERSPPVAAFVMVGVGMVWLGASQLGGPPLRRRGQTDKPLDKPSASRHLAGPGRIWRPR